MQTPRPLTATALAALVDAATPTAVRRVTRVVSDPSLTPRSLREPYSKNDWRSLSVDQRMAAARRNIRGELFDNLVAKNRVTLSPAERAELRPAR